MKGPSYTSPKPYTKTLEAQTHRGTGRGTLSYITPCTPFPVMKPPWEMPTDFEGFWLKLFKIPF